MKKLVLIFASLLLYESSIAQVIRDNRKRPKNTENQKVSPASTTEQPSIIYAPQVILYEQGKYGGQSKAFGPGSYRFNTPADFNDLASSLRIPKGYVAVIYEHANESGGYGSYIDLMEDSENLNEYGFNDKVSYLTVFSTASRPGYVYIRNRRINDQFVAGHWEREKAGTTKVDNSLPAISSILQPIRPAKDPNSGIPAFEEMVVYRIQLRITTGTGTDAGTDDPIFTQLNGLDDKFFLVKGIDNFEEGSTVTYDVLSVNIRKVKDIEFVRFGVRDDDGVCIKKVELFLNNNPIALFSKIYPGAKGLCIDNGSTTLMSFLEIHGSQLRQSNSWNFLTPVLNVDDLPAMARAPVMISKDWIISMIEAAIGHHLGRGGNGELQWGTAASGNLWGDAVEAKKLNDHTLHFDLDMQMVRLIRDAGEEDVDFDLDFHCDNGMINCEVENLQGITGVLTAPFQLLTKTVFDKLKYVFPVVAGSNRVVCTRALVTDNGDILLK